MNLELSDEQLALRDTVRRYLSDRAGISTHVRRMLDDPRGTTDEVWRGLVDLGATALLIPVEHGGEAMSMTDAGLVCEELGAALYPGPLLSTAVAAPRALARFGADGDRAAALFGGIADGSLRVAVAAPADGDALTLTERDGSVTVHGSIEGVPDAAAADVLLVVGAGPRPALGAVPLTSPQVSVTAEAAIDMTRKPFRVDLDGARGDRVAVADEGAVEALVDDLVIAWAADALGAAGRLLQLTVDHAKVRHQFGAPIGSFQAVAHMCVDMYEAVELARSGVAYALWAADAADRFERHRAALRLKAFAGRLAGVGDTAIQVFGGIGFTWEHDAQLYLRRLLGFSRFLGPPGEHAERLGRELVRRTT
ncbi:acyl-CoA dehydrogenase family protein [Mycolicibacterium arseniciresistens]|uniref:Acyl-CoA dehydrogenase family protein n=1 Tax=Mycolicibacterium arseniciresistens TaxID=3062257 RepID=A0ABT8UIR2_9MYCO|nr:acyl-CoA dehydrogenase family protein [Mycolicibacterium arseniciresistens]MDO3636690.1 acyl-CoA dehydrogenase family protein [Mycolicibacterium arseniciresistens]